MKADPNKCREMIAVMRSLIADQAKLDRLDLVAHDLENQTKKRRDKARVDGNWLCLDMERQLHEAHCIAVELGLAQPEPHRYTERTVNPDGWHQMKDARRAPKV